MAETMQKRTAVIMAGGRGERFWPKSRTACPKQFLSLTGEDEIRYAAGQLEGLYATLSRYQRR